MSKDIELIADYYEKKLQMPEVANTLRANAAKAREQGGPEELPKNLFSKKPVAEVKTVTLSLLQERRKFREAVDPFIQEYKSTKSPDPDLINRTWKGIWTVTGQKVGYDYQVPECDRTVEELAQLNKEHRVVLLLPDDIYTPEGLNRLYKAFTLVGNFAVSAAEVTHESDKGGCIDIEKGLNSGYRGSSEKEVLEKIVADGRTGMRLPTYVVGSQFSKLLTGSYFDHQYMDYGFSILFGSRCKDSVLVSRFRPSHFFVGIRSNLDTDFGVRSEGIKQR